MDKEDMSATVIIRGRLSCGHFCHVLYEMGEHTLTLKTGPLIFIDPTSVFPDPSLLFASSNKTLELSGAYEVQFRGINVQDGRFVCAECGTLLLAIGPHEDEHV